MPLFEFRVPRSRILAAPLALALSVTLMAGCTKPNVALKPSEIQQGANNLRDWQRAADRVVQAMADQFIIPGGAPPQGKAGEPPPPPPREPMPGPFYVNVMSQGSTFLQEVKQTIEAELMRRDVDVARGPAGATVINLDIDVVRWGADHIYAGGALAAVGIGGAVADIIATSSPVTAAGTAALIGAGAVATDVGLAAYPMTDSEAVWRATIVSNNRVLMKADEVLYINPSDIALYRGTVELAAMSTPGLTQFGSARQLRYAP
jgi:hypothetical protein